MKIFMRSFSFLLLVSISFSHLSVVAADITPQIPNGPAQCSSFQNIQITGAADKSITAPGRTFLFTGQIKNSSSVPINSGSLYAVVKLKNDTSPVARIIDKSLVASGLNVNAGDMHSFSSSWNVPQGLPGGDYVMSFIIASAGDTMLLNSVSSDIPISVASSNTVFPAAVASASVSVGTAGTKVSFSVTNNTSAKQLVLATVDLLPWDLVTIKPVQSQIVNMTLQPNKTVSNTLSFGNLPIPSENFAITLDLGNGLKTTYILQALNPAIENTRITFAGITKDNLAFVCLASTTFSKITQSKITLLVKGDNDQVLGNYSFTAVGTGVPSAVVMALDPMQTPPAHLSVTATVFKNNNQIDTVTVSYQCGSSSTSSCPLAPQATASSPSWWAEFIIVLLALILAAAAGYEFYKKKKSPQNPPASPSY
jgi:hypothetical protein